MATFSKKRWGRRVGTAIVWAVLAYASSCLQPVLNMDVSLLTLVINKSAWIAGILILGLTGTDYIQARNAGNTDT